MDSMVIKEKLDASNNETKAKAEKLRTKYKNLMAMYDSESNEDCNRCLDLRSKLHKELETLLQEAEDRERKEAEAKAKKETEEKREMFDTLFVEGTGLQLKNNIEKRFTELERYKAWICEGANEETKNFLVSYIEEHKAMLKGWYERDNETAKAATIVLMMAVGMVQKQ